MRFLHANIINIGLSGVLAVINMILNIIEARILGPAGIGVFQLYISTQTVVITICALGLGNAGIYFINTKQITISDFLSTVIKAEIWLVAIVIATLFCIIFFNESYFGRVPLISLIIFCIGSAATLVTTALTPVLLANFQIYKYQSVSFITSILSIIVIFIVNYSLGEFLVGYLLIIIGGANIMGLVALFVILRKEINLRFKFNFKRFNPILKYGFQFSISNIAYILILNIPIYLITFLLPESKFQDIGFYTRAVAICTIAMFVNTQIGPLFFAKMSSCALEEKISNTKLMSSFFVIFNIFMILFINVFASLIINLLYGNQFEPATILVRILSVSIFFSGVNELAKNLFSSIGKPKYIFYNLLISIVILVPLIVILIKLLGLDGVPLAVSITSIATCFLLVNALKNHIQVSFRDFFFISPSRIKKCVSYIKSQIKS